MKGYAQKKKYANDLAVSDWEERKALVRQQYFNHAPGEYDTSGSEYVTSDSEPEEQVIKKKKKSKKTGGSKARGKK